ncbi:VOC family protein [Glaciibacter superstes]|uniref:VOC family protein n=1 Tax=Glaciibacter superstes TaxID=501023 RepID=UPI0003B354B2|nr:VOC family protein [Glaciibacter superstes]
MSTMIFVNLPVADLQRSVDFWTALGYSFNPQFTDENATSLIIEEDHIYAMLLTRDYFKTFTKKEIADSSSAEVIIALSADSREAVDKLADTALANGGSVASDPQEFGFMYGRSFLDPDGHQWEVSWMDMSQMPETPVA